MEIDAPVAHAPGSSARIVLEGAVNTRDLGGYVTREGARVKSGKMIRSDALGKLTEADTRRLAELSLSRVIDFRTAAEIEAMGADVLPPGVPLISRPIDDTGMFLRMAEAIQSKEPGPQQLMLGDGAAERIVEGVYRSFFTPDTLAKFGATVEDLAAADAAVLFHCTAGKDRTGWLAYIVLQAVGVPEPVARQDYFLTNEFRADADAATRAHLKQSGYMDDPDLLIPLQTVSDRYLELAVGLLRDRYGDLTGYLTEGLALSPATIARLRENLVG
ncbi:tyrosine-protein phosphatase [Nocardia sp. NPDC004722]